MAYNFHVEEESWLEMSTVHEDCIDFLLIQIFIAHANLLEERMSNQSLSGYSIFWFDLKAFIQYV